MQGNPLAVLRCQQRDSILFVSTLPVDSSTLGVADHHSRYCLDVDTHVDNLWHKYDLSLCFIVGC